MQILIPKPIITGASLILFLNWNYLCKFQFDFDGKWHALNYLKNFLHFHPTSNWSINICIKGPVTPQRQEYLLTMKSVPDCGFTYSDFNSLWTILKCILTLNTNISWSVQIFYRVVSGMNSSWSNSNNSTLSENDIIIIIVIVITIIVIVAV